MWHKIESTRKSPILHEWKISLSRLAAIRGTKSNQTSSLFFPVPGHQRLKYGLHFAYGDVNHPGQAILKFELQNLSGREYESDITFKIESAEFTTKTDAIFDSDSKAIEMVICPWDELFFPEKQYINEDEELVIKCQGLLIGNIMYYPVEKHFPPVETAIKLWDINQGKTAVIDVKGQPIFLDVKVFKQMFNPNLVRFDQATVSSFNYKTAERAVKFHYHPHLVYPATFAELMDVAEFFERFGSNDSLELFHQFLLQQINENTVCQIAKCAVLTGHEILQLKCADFLKEYIKYSTPIADFWDLPKKFAADLLESCYNRRLNTIE
uniref:BTB domain-containing protein n=1 Tax=Panagrolaimus sp. ES5 TaxID=591445 RepID=A0AC34F5E9_9BILA